MRKEKIINQVTKDIDILMNRYQIEISKTKKTDIVRDIMCLETLFFDLTKKDLGMEMKLSDFDGKISDEMRCIISQNISYENQINSFLFDNLEHILRVIDNIIESIKIPNYIITPEKARKSKVLMKLNSFESKKFKSFVFKELESGNVFCSKLSDKKITTLLSGVQYHISTLNKSYYSVEKNRNSSYSDLFVSLHELSHGYISSINNSLVEYSMLKEVFPLYNELKLNHFYLKTSDTYNTSLLYEIELLTRLKNIALKFKDNIDNWDYAENICRMNFSFNNILLEFIGQILSLYLFDKYLDKPKCVDRTMRYLCENVGGISDYKLFQNLGCDFDNVSSSINVNKILTKSRERAKL